jgi:hypothetical protein
MEREEAKKMIEIQKECIQNIARVMNCTHFDHVGLDKYPFIASPLYSPLLPSSLVILKYYIFFFFFFLIRFKYRYSKTDVGRLLHFGQGNCHTVASLTTSILLPFCKLIGSFFYSLLFFFFSFFPFFLFSFNYF